MLWESGAIGADVEIVDRLCCGGSRFRDCQELRLEVTKLVYCARDFMSCVVFWFFRQPGLSSGHLRCCRLLSFPSGNSPCNKQSSFLFHFQFFILLMLYGRPTSEFAFCLRLRQLRPLHVIFSFKSELVYTKRVRNCVFISPC